MYTSIQSVYMTVKYYFETFFQSFYAVISKPDLKSEDRGNLDGKFLENIQQDPHRIK